MHPYWRLAALAVTCLGSPGVPAGAAAPIADATLRRQAHSASRRPRARSPSVEIWHAPSTARRLATAGCSGLSARSGRHVHRRVGRRPLRRRRPVPAGPHRRPLATLGIMYWNVGQSDGARWWPTPPRSRPTIRRHGGPISARTRCAGGPARRSSTTRPKPGSGGLRDRRAGRWPGRLSCRPAQRTAMSVMGREHRRSRATLQHADGRADRARPLRPLPAVRRQRWRRWQRPWCPIPPTSTARSARSLPRRHSRRQGAAGRDSNRRRSGRRFAHLDLELERTLLPSMIEAEQYFSADSCTARSTAARRRPSPVTTNRMVMRGEHARRLRRPLGLELDPAVGDRVAALLEDVHDVERSAAAGAHQHQLHRARPQIAAAMLGPGRRSPERAHCPTGPRTSDPRPT